MLHIYSLLQSEFRKKNNRNKYIYNALINRTIIYAFMLLLIESRTTINYLYILLRHTGNLLK